MAVSARNFFSSILKFSVSSWISFVMGIVSVMLLTRLFTPEVYGAWNFFNTTSAILVGVACLGLDGSFLRFYYELPPGWTVQELLTKCLCMSLLFLLIIFLVGSFFFVAQISIAIFNQVSFFLMTLLFVNVASSMVLTQFYASYFRVGNDPFNYTVERVLVEACSKLLVIAAAFISPDLETIVIINVIGICTLLLIYTAVQRRKLFTTDLDWRKPGLSEIIKYGLFSWPLCIFLPLADWLNSFFITKELGNYSLGIYASAGFFVSAFAVVQGGFRTYWAAFMYKHYKDEQAKIKKIHNYVAVFVIFILGAFILLQHIMYMFIGEQFHSSRLFFSLVLLSPLLGLYEQTTSYGMAISKRNEQSTAIYVLFAILNVVLLYILLPYFSVLGAAIASAGAAVVRFVLLTWRGQLYYDSIETKCKTLSGLTLIVLLAVSNCIFATQYTIEVGAVLILFFISAIIYRSDLTEAYEYVKSA